MLIKLVPVVVVLVCLLSFVCTVLTNSESDCVSEISQLIVSIFGGSSQEAIARRSLSESLSSSSLHAWSSGSGALTKTMRD
ncbi:unnamed protein product [Heligmosomoides polygyrus]|uniref:Secreted protein n=1 Tax=Heligmosomoides polygyrus TaxID=6339 RepID=A0A183FYC6_HELPZ|nr:unnamed protein product [Heligmosomoides polygyrus]